MKHINEETLELFILESPDVAEQRDAIEAHLASCAGCAALHHEIAEYYADVRAEQDERERATSQALTVRSLVVKIPTYTEFGPLSQIQKTWPARIVLFVIRHPLASAVGTLGTIGLFSLALLTLAPKDLFKDTNPAYARAKEEYLITYNKEGEVLWKKHIGIGYDIDKLNELKPDEYLTTVDVNGDGKREIIALFRIDSPMNRYLICYSADGTERWRYEFRRKMVFGTEAFSDIYDFKSMIVGDFDKDGKTEIIAVASSAGYYPTVILKVDASTGHLLSEYWSSGNINQVAHRDFDGDGVEELFFAGVNNGYDRAMLLVLDPRNFSGHTPAPATHTPHGIPEGTEKYYTLFPRGGLQKVADQKRNNSRALEFLTDSSFMVAVGELVDNKYYVELYHFNRSMACWKVDWQDLAMALHLKLLAEGKLTRKPDSAYYEELRRGVQYWDGEKFVSGPTMNKRYVEAMKQMAKK